MAGWLAVSRKTRRNLPIVRHNSSLSLCVGHSIEWCIDNNRCLITLHSTDIQPSAASLCAMYEGVHNGGKYRELSEECNMGLSDGSCDDWSGDDTN